MDRSYVEWLRVENFRCVRSVDVHLTPLHAFIGPNDSGKSTLLGAIRGIWQIPSVTVWVHATGKGYSAKVGFFAGEHPKGPSDRIPKDDAVEHALAPIALLRLDPDELRKPVGLIQTGSPLWFANERGVGLAALYDALQSRDVDAFLRIRSRFVELFPTVRSLRLENPSATTKALGLTLTDGSEVGAVEMSEGMLYWLAFAIVECLAPQAILLVEEPENGLHPSRIVDVMRVFREMSTRTQIIVATHSPLVINELEPDEVTIVTRTREAGTICTPMTKTKNFAERSKVYALGELWLSYADGDFETELVDIDKDTMKAG